MESIPSQGVGCPRCGQALDTSYRYGERGTWTEGGSRHPIHYASCPTCRASFRAYGREGEPLAALAWEEADPVIPLYRFIKGFEWFWEGKGLLPQRPLADLVADLKKTSVRTRFRALLQLERLGRAGAEAAPAIERLLTDQAEEWIECPMGYNPSMLYFYYVRHAAVFALYAVAPERMSAAQSVMIELAGKPIYYENDAVPTDYADKRVEFSEAMWAAAGGRPPANQALQPTAGT